MTTIAAVSQPADAAVLLTVTATATVTAITRTDVNGTAAVRTLPGLLPHTAGSFVLTDYEAAAGLVTYAVQSSAPAACSLTVTLTGPRLSSLVLPAYFAAVDLVEGYTAARATTATLHDVIDRADPVVTLGVMRLRTGTLTMWARDYAAARAIEAVYARGEVALFRQTQYPGLDMYHVALDEITVTPHDPATAPRRWSVVVPFVEVARPTGANILGTLGWSFDDVAATYATFTAVPAVFATFNDLTTGP